jgi:RNA polymerase sigma factor (sigma-70 family)
MGELRMSDSRDVESFKAYYGAKERFTKPRMRKLLSGTGADWENIHGDAWARFAEKYLDPAFTFETSFDSYLNACMDNAARSYLREYLKRRPSVELDELVADTSQSVVDQVAERLEGSAELGYDPAGWVNRDLADALEALSPQQRAVTLFLAQTSPKPTDREIAEEFEIGESTAKTHRTRALAKLRQALSAPATREKEESK